MDPKLEQAQDMFLEKINQICREFGLNHVMAQLYAILYFSSSPLSLDEMADRLKISKGSVSINIRALERYGATKKVWVKQTRRDYYEAETDVFRVFMQRVQSMAQRRLSGIEDMITSAYEAINSVNPKDAEEKEAVETFKRRLGALKDLKEKGESAFNLLNSSLIKNILNFSLPKTKKTEKTYAGLDR